MFCFYDETFHKYKRKRLIIQEKKIQISESRLNDFSRAGMKSEFYQIANHQSAITNTPLT